jgi:plastocyanin domain-containing protein
MTKLGIALLAPVLLFPLACKKESAPTAPPAAPVAPAAPAAAPAPSGPVAAPADGALAMSITEEGFVPSRILAKAGQPLVLAITRKTEKTCATEILFHGQEGKTDLPLNKTVQVTYTPKSSGPVKFGCAMGMMIGGVIEVSP